jgi:uncharacterized protein (TIGR04255 family)
MTLELPEADKRPLGRAPLELVVSQVKFDETLAISDSRTILSVHNKLGGRSGFFPHIQESQVQSTEVLMGPAGPAALPTSKTQRGWQLVSDDGAWTATLLPDSLALQTTQYTSWQEDFGPKLSGLIEAVDQAVDISMEQRVGVRYVDRIVLPQVVTPNQWKGLIAPEFLGPVLHDRLGGCIKAALQQIDLDIADGVRGTLRHGPLPPAGRSAACHYVFDTDVYRDGVREFVADDVKKAAYAFHDWAVRIFQQLLTSELYEYLLKEEH